MGTLESGTEATPPEPPAPGRHLHLETDASVNQARTRGGVHGQRTFLAGAGIVLRSEAMHPLVVESISLGYVESATHAEGLALRLGIRRARRMGASSLRVRSDCAPFVSVLNGRSEFEDPSLALLAEELRRELGGLREFQILWTRSFHARSRGDGVPAADHLAREAAGLSARTPFRGRR